MRDDDWEPPAHDRLRRHTDDDVLRRIDADTRAELDSAQAADTIRARLAELDREWDVDRAVMLNFAIVGALSGGLAMRNLARHGRLGGWGAMFWTQMAFLAHHAIRGWCPPLPVFRRLGFRSQQEIDAERATLRERLVARDD